MHYVGPRLYTTVIREMIRHENDVTNHRIMWLRIGEGLIANAYVSSSSQREDSGSTLSLVGILVTFSTFVILYKSYQARGYLQFLGDQAKRGTLREEDLPLFGWPRKRTKGWRRNLWICPWLRKTGDLLEPYMFLPSLLILAWLFVLMQHDFSLDKGTALIVSISLEMIILCALCVVWVWREGKDECEQKYRKEEPVTK
jgi:hypothetical protein